MLFNGVMKGNLDIVLVTKSLAWNWLSFISVHLLMKRQTHLSMSSWQSNNTCTVTLAHACTAITSTVSNYIEYDYKLFYGFWKPRWTNIYTLELLKITVEELQTHSGAEVAHCSTKQKKFTKRKETKSQRVTKQH